MRRCIAVIPARGGSKRIPSKNIVEFVQKPLIAWTIEAALESRIFDRVLVSTDSQEIADISRKFGADVPFLRDHYCDDISPVSMVTIYALQQLRDRLGENYVEVVQLMPNCPLRNSQDIAKSYENFKKSGSLFQISCFKFGWMNPWWAVKLNMENVPTPLFPDALKTRSQDLEDLFCPTGAIWIAQTNVLIDQGTFYGPGYRFFSIPWESAVDIDNYEDLNFAKAIFQKKVN